MKEIKQYVKKIVFFSEYNSETQKAKCQCKVQEYESFSSGSKIDKDNLYKNFIDINNIANIKIMKCYKVLFNKKGIIKNIAFYIVAAIILFHIIVIIIFYNNQRYSLNNKIKEIIFGLKNMILVGQNKQKKIKVIKFEKIHKKKNKNLKKCIKIKKELKDKNNNQDILKKSRK